MANLCLINTTHGTVADGGRKSHILNLETGNILCGRNVSGGFGADVDYDYLTVHPIPILMENICVKCLKRAFDVLEVELEKIINNSMNEIEKQLAKLDRESAEDSAVRQLIDLFNDTDPKDIDITPLELVIRNSFDFGIMWKTAVQKKEEEDSNKKTYEDGLSDMRDKALDAFLECEGYDEFDMALGGSYMD